MKKLALFTLLLSFSVSALADVSERYSLGLGYAEQRYNSRHFKHSANYARGHLDFRSVEVRGMALFGYPEQIMGGGEAVLHWSTNKENTTEGTVGYQALSLNGLVNITIFPHLGIEGGVGVSNAFSPSGPDEATVAIGVLYGVTYLLENKWELRLRREDKTAINSYDIQPAYSFSVSYLF